MPAMPGAGLVMIEAEFVLGGLETILDRPAMSFDLDQVSIGVPLGHQVEKKAISPSAMLRRIKRPRVHCPVRLSSYSPASRSASSTIGPVVQPRPLVPSPADRRFQAVEGSARSSRRCRDAAACPRNGTHGCAARQAHSLCRLRRSVFDLANAVDGVGRNPGEWHVCGGRPSDHREQAEAWLRSQFAGTCAAFSRRGRPSRPWANKTPGR